MNISRYKLNHEQRIAQVAAAVVGSAVVGGVMNSKAAGKAADAQSAAAEQANATQRYMYDQTRADQAPFRETGLAANNRLAHLLGIGRDPSVSTGGMSYEQMLAMADADHRQKYGLGIDEIDQNVANAWKDQMRAAAAAGNDANSIGGQWGSLLKNFDQNDLANDVIYQNTHQYAQDQGNLGVNRLASASGSQLSGATLKALQKSGANIANQYGNEAFNRSNTEKTNIYNRLAGLSGAGQQATNQVGAAGGNMANQISQNQTALGNARGASAIAQGNAWNNALATGANAYQQQNYMNSRNNYGGSGGYNDEMARLNSQAGGY